MPGQFDGVKISSFPDASEISNSDRLTGLKSGANTNFTFATIMGWIRDSIQAFFVPNSAKGAANGVASLDNTGKVPSSQLPPISSDADDITYDPTTSGASATNVQDALDEAFSDLDGKQDKITASGILKGDGAGGVSAATAGTDYQAPLTAGTDYATPTQLDSKANQSQLAYVETGTTASRNYTAGQYISLNGLLCKADTAIASGATFYTSGGNKNLTECVGGGFNSLAFPTERTTSFTSNNYTVNCYRYGYVGEIRVYRNAAAGADITLDTQLPAWACPLHDALTQRSYGDNSGFLQIAKNGNVRIKQNANTGWFSATICYLTDPTT